MGGISKNKNFERYAKVPLKNKLVHGERGEFGRMAHLVQISEFLSLTGTDGPLYERLEPPGFAAPSKLILQLSRANFNIFRTKKMLVF